MQEPMNIGVDVAKAELVYCVDGTRQRGAIPNTVGDIEVWLRGIAAGTRFAMESTGRYHQALATLAHRAGMVVYVLNPADVRHYRRSEGVRGKTDQIDAEVIARMLGERHKRWHHHLPGTALQQEIDTLLRRRGTLATQRGALRQSLQDVPAVRAQVAATLAAFDELLAALDAQIQLRVAAEPQVAQAYERIEQISGYGLQGAAVLANLFTRVPFGNADAVVAYSGLDPRPNDSGQHQGRRRISKRGPAELRRLIYLCALSATRSKAWKPVYEAIRARGFSSTQALVILARKLLRVAFSIYKSGQPFDPSRLIPRGQPI